MFDYVVCHAPLPDSTRPSGRTFQTKDFEYPSMDIYTITAAGRLMVEDVHFDEVPKAERPYPDAPDDSLLSLLGSMRRVVDGSHDVGLHGDLHFYEWHDNHDGGAGEWEEYRARFTLGQLESIERVQGRQ